MSVSPNAFDQFDGGNAFDQFTPPETTKRIGGRDFSVMPNYTVNPKDYPKDTAPAEPPRFGPSPEGWDNFYSGLDGLQERLNPIQKFAFGQLAKKSDDSEETQAQAINQAYVKAHLPSYSESQFDQNWPSIRDAYASQIYGIDHQGVTDKELYSAISERLKDEKFANLTNADWKEVAEYKLHNFSREGGEFWNRINEPLHKLPAAPALPDIPWMGEKNPALVAGVYNGIKPLVEGMESPFGILTLGVGGELNAARKAGSVAARRALAGMTGIFTGLMAKSVVEQAEKIKPVLDDPKASFQDKVTAVAEPVGTSAMVLLGALGTIHEIAPEFAGKTFHQLEGANPEGAAVILRQEAKTTESAPLVQALHNAADQMEAIGPKTEPAAEAKPAEKQVGTVQEMDNGGFVVTDAQGKLIDYANSREEAQALAEGKTMEAESTGKPKAPAELLSPETEEGFPATYNLTEDIPGHPKGSTVSRQTLDKAGFEVPEDKPQPEPIKEAPKPTDEPLAGIKNEQMAAELKEMGLEAPDKAERETFEGNLADAAAKMEKDPQSGQRLIEELSKEPRPLTGKEDALLSHEVNRLSLERDAAARELDEARNSGDGPRLAEARAKQAEIIEKYQKAADVFDKVGTANSYGLGFRRIMLKRDFSLAAIERRWMQANEGKPLTAEHQAEIGKLTKELADLQKKFDQHRAEQAAPEKAARKPGKIAKSLSDHAEAARKRILDRLKEGRSASGLDPLDIADHAIVGADYIAKGLTKFTDWAAKMVEEFGDVIRPHLSEIYARAEELKDTYAKKDITPDQRMKMIEGAITKEISDIEKQLKNDAPFEPNKKPSPTNASIEAKRAKLEQLKLEREYARNRIQPDEDPAEPPIPLTKEQIALKSLKTRLKNQTEGLQERLDNQDFEKPAKKGPTPLDAEAFQLKAAMERVKRKVELGEMKLREANRSTPEKVRDSFLKWVRVGALSWPTVLAKLTGAAIIRTASTPLEQAVGFGISKLLPDLASAAPREGVPSLSGALKAEAKAISEGLTTGMKGAADMLANRDTDLHALLEKQHLPPTLVEWLGKLHGALKYPTKINEYARALELRTQNALAHGIDPTDPIQQLRLMHEAWMDSNRAVFMQDNGVVNAYKAAIGVLEAKDKATGKPNTGLQLLSTAIQTEMPIVKVPTNVIAEASQIMTGWLTGPAKAAFAYAKGIENLKPAEADAIMRLMKKGSLGLALTALGFFKAKQFGGFYEPGEKRKPDDLKPNEIEVGDTHVPSQLLHNPYMTALQFGATLEHAATSRLNGHHIPDYGHGLLAASIGLVEETPFLRETTTLGKYLDSRQAGNAISQKAAGVIVPGVVQWTAAQLDKENPFSPFETATPRKANGLQEQLMKATPGLRQDLRRKGLQTSPR